MNQFGLRSVASIAAVGLLFVPSSNLRAKTELDWDPEHIWVFAVGLLQWEHSEIYASFPACMKDRRDEQIVKYFRAAGVPKSHITYLQDAAATKGHIQSDFRTLLDKADGGDLLIFYFCGHGYRDAETRQTWFASYDAGDTNESGWNVHSIFTAIEKHFSGDRALLLADCCHSGALYDECRRHSNEDGDDAVAYATIASSFSHNTSTGHWTFSDSLLAGLHGEPQVDLNHDGIIELNEIAHYTDLELAFLEGQKSMFFADEEFPRAAKLAWVDGDDAPRIGQRIEVEYKDRWYKAKIIAVDGDQVKVHYANFDDSWDEWVGPERTRPYQPEQFAAGDNVEVQWQGDEKWYPATVRKAWYGLHLVHYDDDDNTNDEWVGPGAIRLRRE